MPEVIEDVLTVVNTPTGAAVGILTINGIKYSPGITLAQGLNAMNIQITESAAGVARQSATLADVVTWLTENLNYQPAPRPSGGTYLTPLYAELTQVPSKNGGKP